VDFASLHAMIARSGNAGSTGRIPEIHEVHVKKALDAGAEASAFRWHESEDVQRCVLSMRYPPSASEDGGRSWLIRAGYHRLFEYAAGPAAETSHILLETVDAVKNIDEICAVEGVHIFVIAPSICHPNSDQRPVEHPR